MTPRRAASRNGTGSTAASMRDPQSRRSSTSTKSGALNSDDRPIKRQRLDRSSTTPALRHNRSITPTINNSNQDADIPDIIPSFEGPSFIDLDNISIVGDEDESVVAGDDEDESDGACLLSPLLRKRGLGEPFTEGSSVDGSVADSLGRATPLDDDLEDLDSDQDPQKAARRMPGRRRAPNSDPFLEACLRRQLELRMGHRAVSKAVKPILLELAARSVGELERKENEEWFWEIEQRMIYELHMRLERRLEILENQLRNISHYHEQQLFQGRQFWHLRFEVICSPFR